LRVFDFDNTIYDGESVFDFALFVIKRKWSLWKYIPGMIKLLLGYKSCRMDIEEFQKSLEKYSKIFLKNKTLIQELVSEFWIQNIEKLYPNMLKRVGSDDVIITSSPEFLIDEIKDVLNTKHILSTKLNHAEGKIEYLNFQENKVKYFHKIYKNKEIDELYTDSYNDKPLMEISKKVYLVKKGVLKRIK